MAQQQTHDKVKDLTKSSVQDLRIVLICRPPGVLLVEMLALSRCCYDNHIASFAIDYESFGALLEYRKGSAPLQRLAIPHQFLKTATHVGILSAMNFGRNHNNF